MMDVSWETLPIYLRKDLVSGILKICGARSYEEVDRDASSWLMTAPTPRGNQPHRSSVLHDGRTGGVGREVAPRVTQRVAPFSVGAGEKTVQMSSQALANLMYAISLLMFDTKQADIHKELTPVHIALLDCISTSTVMMSGVGGSRFTEAEREQILIYISTLQTLTPLDAAVTHKPRCVINADRALAQQSKLQKGVVAALTRELLRRNADLEVLDEYSAFNGAFPVDATIFEGDLLA